MLLRLNYLRNISLSTISLCAAITNSSIAMQKETTSVDIAIIGGGMAGLTASYELSNSGLSSCLFEAKPEVGGRTKTYYFNENQYYELGGTQIDSDHSSVITLANKLGVELNTVFYGEGKFSVCHAGKPLSDMEMLNILDETKKVFGEYKDYNPERDLIFDTSTQNCKFQSIRIAIDQFSCQEGKRFWEAFIKEECGTEPDLLPVTMASWLYEEASDYQKLLVARNVQGGSSALILAAKMKVNGTYSYRVKGGMSNLVHSLRDSCKDTKFEYNHVLKSLSKDESGYHLVFGNRTVTAQNVIMAIPFSTLRDVEFGKDFGLNDTHINAIQNLNYGTISKIGLPATGEFDMLGHFNIDEDRQFHAWPGHNAVTLAIGGEQGKNLGDDHTATLFQEIAIQSLPQIHPGMSEFGKAHIKNWAKDPFAKGTWSTGSRELNYTSEPSKVFPQLCKYAEPIHENTFIFAGEHTIYAEGRSRIEGAVLSGKIAAGIILKNRNISQKDEKENCTIQ